MNYPTFTKLVESLREEIDASPSSFRADTIRADKRVAMVLYYLKDQGSYRMTANTYLVSPYLHYQFQYGLFAELSTKNLGPSLFVFHKQRKKFKTSPLDLKQNLDFLK